MIKLNRRNFLVGASSLLPLSTLSLERSRSIARLNSNKLLQKFCFGSCNSHLKNQKHFDIIQSKNPDLWLWLGDNLYGDTDDMDELRGKYQNFKSNPYYKNFIKNVPTIGIWDDHDYGRNNAGKEYPYKKESQQIFLDFINEPKNTARRRQKGIYTSYTLGPVGKRVKFILVDTRYNRDSPKDDERDLLGREQWDWVEEELRTSDAQLHFFGSSIGVIGHNLGLSEDWEDFPDSQQRLFSLIETYRPSGLFFLSGDKHFAAFTKQRVGGDLFHEMMSSGMTHSVLNITKPVIRGIYGTKASLKKNFGEVSIDWSGISPVIHNTVFDVKGKSRIEQRLSLNSEGLLVKI